jgi:hypothetical protein
MKTVPSGMLFGQVARNFRQLVGSRRVGREVEALSLTIRVLTTVETIITVALTSFLHSGSETQCIERFPEILECISSCLL